MFIEVTSIYDGSRVLLSTNIMVKVVELEEGCSIYTYEDLYSYENRESPRDQWKEAPTFLVVKESIAEVRKKLMAVRLIWPPDPPPTTQPLTAGGPSNGKE